MHRHGISPGGDISDHDITERLDRLEHAPCSDDPDLRRDVLQTLDVLAEHLVGQRLPDDEQVKTRIHRLRARVAGV